MQRLYLKSILKRYSTLSRMEALVSKSTGFQKFLKSNMYLKYQK